MVDFLFWLRPNVRTKLRSLPSWGDGQADHEARTFHHFRSESADRPCLVVVVLA
jgi:hypothetical protein